MRRYQDQLIAIGYHGSSHVVATTVPDSIWDRMHAWYPAYYRPDTSMIDRRSIFTVTGDTLRGVGWVNGRPPSVGVGGTSLWAQEAVNAADTVLARPPEAFIDLTVTREADQVQVKVMVDSLIGRHQRLALRIALVEDTVRIRGGTTRRMHLYVNRLQARAQGYPLGLPISATRIREASAFRSGRRP
jgi:hypothetical protein